MALLSNLALGRRADLPEIGPLLERPFHVSVFLVRRADFAAAADHAGDERDSVTEIKTYWVKTIEEVAIHVEVLREQHALAGWEMVVGPIGESWSWLAARDAAYRAQFSRAAGDKR